MRTTSIQQLGHFQLKKGHGRPRDTAYFIFDKDWTYLYDIDTAHFKAKNHALHFPVVASSLDEMEWISHQPISTSGTIWEIVTQFLEGATIAFRDVKIPADIYRRIVNHLDAHLLAMRTEKSYSPPDVEDFRHLAEFATAIRSQAVDHDSDIDSTQKKNQNLMQFMSQRPTFSMATTPPVTAKPQVAKSVAKMDSIERYLEMIGHGY